MPESFDVYSWIEKKNFTYEKYETSNCEHK